LEKTKRGGKHVIISQLQEIDSKIEVDKEYVCHCPKRIKTYNDLISELKKCLAKDYAKV
jgi:hypothetical protein